MWLMGSVACGVDGHVDQIKAAKTRVYLTTEGVGAAPLMGFPMLSGVLSGAAGHRALLEHEEPQGRRKCKCMHSRAGRGWRRQCMHDQSHQRKGQRCIHANTKQGVSKVHRAPAATAEWTAVLLLQVRPLSYRQTPQ